MNARMFRIVRTVLFVVLAFSQMGNAVAQGADTYTTVTGQVLAWADPWVIDDEKSIRSDDTDLTLLSDGAAIIAVATGPIDAGNARGLVLGFVGGDIDAADTLDSGGSASSAYWFERLPIDGRTHGVFSIATPNRLVMCISPVGTFADSMSSAQNTITLDGSPLFANIDGAALQAQLDVPAAAAADPLPEFVPAGQWVDPEFGVQLLWNATWEPQQRQDDLEFVLGRTDFSAMLTVRIYPRDGTTPQQWADEQVLSREEMWGSYDFLPQYIGDDEVLTIGREASGQGGLVQEVLFLDDGETVVTVGLVAIEGDPVEAAIEYRESVRIDGRVPLEDVDLDALTAPANAPGIVGDGQYVSPRFDIAMTWDPTAWEPYPSSAECATSDPSRAADSLHLTWASGEHVWVDTFIGPMGSGTLEEIVAYNAEPEVYQRNYGTDAEYLVSVVEGTQGANVYRASDGVDTAVIYEAYTLVDDGSIVVVTVYMALVSDVPASLPSAQEAITVEGSPILRLFTAEDIITLLEGEATPAP